MTTIEIEIDNNGDWAIPKSARYYETRIDGDWRWHHSVVDSMGFTDGRHSNYGTAAMLRLADDNLWHPMSGGYVHADGFDDVGAAEQSIADAYRVANAADQR